MKKKIINAILIMCAIIALMFAEYRIIMVNMTPSIGDDGLLYIELFGREDVYDLGA